MKKRIVAMVLALALSLSMTAYAAETRTVPITPTLSFSGTTAHCSVTVIQSGKEIDVTLTLYRELSRIASWSGSGENVVTVRGSAAVKDGLEYRLVATGTIDGTPFTSVEIVGTC